MSPAASEALTEVALERLFAELERPIYNLVYRYVWDAEEARELVQEAFLRLWGMRARVRVETADRLLWRIALNLAARRYRRRGRWSWLGLSGREAGQERRADDALADAEQQARLRAAVEALPEAQRAVVMLLSFSGLSYAQAAEVLQIPVGTVASRKNKALARLRGNLGVGDE